MDGVTRYQVDAAVRLTRHSQILLGWGLLTVEQ